jgi:predicted nuclease of predicted toxin-antitoxin system
MRIYLDDNVTDRRIRTHLQRAGHDVVAPPEVGQDGVSDAKHLEYAIRHNFVLLTQDCKDFTDLHDLVRASGGGHPGMLLIYTDNDPARDMTPRGIAVAITKLEAAEVPLANQLYVLNHWR